MKRTIKKITITSPTPDEDRNLINEVVAHASLVEGRKITQIEVIRRCLRKIDQFQQEYHKQVTEERWEILELRGQVKQLQDTLNCEAFWKDALLTIKDSRLKIKEAQIEDGWISGSRDSYYGSLADKITKMFGKPPSDDFRNAVNKKEKEIVLLENNFELFLRKLLSESLCVSFFNECAEPQNVLGFFIDSVLYELDLLHRLAASTTLKVVIKELHKKLIEKFNHNNGESNE